MVLITTGLSSQSQHKNRVWKLRSGFRKNGKNVSKYEGLDWRPEFWHIVVNCGPNACFLKLIFALKPGAQAGCFEYHEANTQNQIFLHLFPHSVGHFGYLGSRRRNDWIKKLRDSFKEEKMIILVFSIMLAGWVLDDQIFYKKWF